MTGKLGPVMRVRFNPPEPCEIQLQGPALRAYETWLENPSYENEDELTGAIYEQCEDYVIHWSTVEEWDQIG